MTLALAQSQPVQSRLVNTARPLRLIKPRGFQRADGVLAAAFADSHTCSFYHNLPKGRTASQKSGKRYEAKVLATLELQGFQLVVPSPWLVFNTKVKIGRLCQPDALVFGEGPDGPWLLILEVKLSHTIMAYWQLRKLYAPVLRVMYPEHEIRVCEITRSFDPTTPWPEDVVLFTDFNALSALRSQEFGVLQWRP